MHEPIYINCVVLYLIKEFVDRFFILIICLLALAAMAKAQVSNLSTNQRRNVSARSYSKFGIIIDFVNTIFIGNE